MGIFRKKKNETSIDKKNTEIEPKKTEPPKAAPKEIEVRDKKDKKEKVSREKYREYDAISDRRRAESMQAFRRTLVAVFFAFLFLMPTVLTFTNSFMTASEINANYGAIFAQNTSSWSLRWPPSGSPGTGER